MRPSYLLGSALCALALFAAADARAQCRDRLDRANHNAREMPDSTPYQVHDQLSDASLEAEELVASNPSACLQLVVKMEALMRRHGKAIVEETGGPAPAAAVAERPRTLDALFPPTERSQRLAQMRTATGGQTRADALALKEYADASRAVGFAVYTATIDSKPGTAAQAVAAADRAVAAAEATQEVMIQINQDGDMLHAQLEDAFRELEAAQRGQARWEKEYGLLAPLTSDPAKNPMKRLELATARLRAVTRKLNEWIERNLEVGFAPGYLGAMRVLEVRYKPKFEQIDKQCEKMREAAYLKMIQAGMSGGKTTAVQEAAGACSKLQEPVEKQRQRDEDEITAKFRLKEGSDALLADLERDEKLAKGSDELLADVERDEKLAKGSDELLANEAADDASRKSTSSKPTGAKPPRK